MYRTKGRGMVGDHNDRGLTVCQKCTQQEGHGLLMPLDDRSRMEPLGLRPDPNLPKIVHGLYGGNHRAVRVSQKIEICPEGCPDEQDTVQRDCVLFQEIEIWHSFRNSPHLLQDLREGFSVKLVVALDIEDGPVLWEVFCDPIYCLDTAVDVPGQNDHIRLDLWIAKRTGFPQLLMEITQDVDPHDSRF